MKLLSIIPCSGGYLHHTILVYRNRKGKIKNYEITSRHAVKKESDLNGFVAGVIIVVHDPSGAYLITREFRLGVNRELFGFPAGMLEPGESLKKCAVRETFEETGVRNVIIDRVTPAMYTNPAMSNERIVIAYGHTERIQKTRGSDNPDEEIKSFWLKPDKIRKLLRTADISAVNRLLMEEIIR